VCSTRSTTTARRSSDVHRRIEEVIKVDQTDEEILREEINEYVVTDAIRAYYTNVFEASRETVSRSGSRVFSGRNPNNHGALGSKAGAQLAAALDWPIAAATPKAVSPSSMTPNARGGSR
jgi:hypothetical protein